jgi:hypothetical protein
MAPFGPSEHVLVAADVVVPADAEPIMSAETVASAPTTNATPVQPPSERLDTLGIPLLARRMCAASSPTAAGHAR